MDFFLEVRGEIRSCRHLFARFLVKERRKRLCLLLLQKLSIRCVIVILSLRKLARVTYISDLKLMPSARRRRLLPILRISLQHGGRPHRLRSLIHAVFGLFGSHGFGLLLEEEDGLFTGGSVVESGLHHEGNILSF